MAKQTDPPTRADDDFTPEERAALRALARQPAPAPAAQPPADLTARLKAFLTRLLSGVLTAQHGDVRWECEQLLAGMGGADLAPPQAPGKMMVKPPVPFAVYAAAERLTNHVGYQGDAEAVLGFVRGDRITALEHAVRAVVQRANEWGVDGGPEPVPGRPTPVPHPAGLAPVVGAQFAAGVGARMGLGVHGHAAQPVQGALGRSTVGEAFDPLSFVPPGTVAATQE